MGVLLTYHAMLGAGSAAGGGGYTTLNPSDKNALITLSGGNLVASTSTTGSGIARSIASITGKKYFEAVFTTSSAGGSNIAAGVANGSHTLTDALGYSNANGWAFWGLTGPGARHNGVTAVTASAVQGDVFGFSVDQPNGRLWIRKNGVELQGNPATGTSPIWSNLSGTLYAAACPWQAGNVVTMRFDPASFRDAAPTGFDPIT